MELPLHSLALNQASEAMAAFFAQQRVVACIGDHFALSCFCLTRPLQGVVVGAATTEDEGVDLVARTNPSLVICTEDLESGYGINLLRRVKHTLPNCKRLILLKRETQSVVQEAMEACADAVIFQSSLGNGKGDFIQALTALAEGSVYYPEKIRRLVAVQAMNADLPTLVDSLTKRELEVVTAVARGLKNQAIAETLCISLETVKTHLANAMGKLGAQDRTQLAVMALLHGLIGPMG